MSGADVDHGTAAALDVIVSLLFVAYEIRQNTNVARATAVQATADQIITSVRSQ